MKRSKFLVNCINVVFLLSIYWNTSTVSQEMVFDTKFDDGKLKDLQRLKDHMDGMSDTKEYNKDDYEILTRINSLLSGSDDDTEKDVFERILLILEEGNNGDTESNTESKDSSTNVFERIRNYFPNASMNQTALVGDETESTSSIGSGILNRILEALTYKTAETNNNSTSISSSSSSSSSSSKSPRIKNDKALLPGRAMLDYMKAQRIKLQESLGGGGGLAPPPGGGFNNELVNIGEIIDDYDKLEMKEKDLQFPNEGLGDMDDFIPEHLLTIKLDAYSEECFYTHIEEKKQYIIPSTTTSSTSTTNAGDVDITTEEVERDIDYDIEGVYFSMPIESSITDPQFDIIIRDIKTNTVQRLILGNQEGHFLVDNLVAGEYSICFKTYNNPMVLRFGIFEDPTMHDIFPSEEQVDYTDNNDFSISDENTLLDRLNALQVEIEDIKSEQLYVRIRQRRDISTQENTNSKVKSGVVFETVAYFSIAVLQWVLVQRLVHGNIFFY